jgi:hypothetical protein
VSGIVSGQTVVTGVVYGTNATPDAKNGSIATSKVASDGTLTVMLTNLSPNTKYYYRAFCQIDGTYAYGPVLSFTTSDSQSASEGTVGTAVDLGLSVKWADHNVGASKPEDYGGYFAWGETVTKSDYSWISYSNLGSISEINGSRYDVAYVKWGDKWRMPTRDEMTELRNNCTWTWVTINGVNGCKITSKKAGYTDKSIFLPAVGYQSGTNVKSRGALGYYWSSTRKSDTYAYSICLDQYGFDMDDSGHHEQCNGFGVRPVAK